MTAVLIVAAAFVPSVLYVLRGWWMNRPGRDQVALARAEADLAPQFEAYAARIDALYGKGE